MSISPVTDLDIFYHTSYRTRIISRQALSFASSSLYLSFVRVISGRVKELQFYETVENSLVPQTSLRDRVSKHFLGK